MRTIRVYYAEHVHKLPSRLRLERRRSAWAILFIAMLVWVSPAAAWAQDVPDPKVAMPILLKVITYDRNFASRGSGEFTVLVVSEPGQSATREEVMNLLRTLKLSSIQNRPLKFVGGEFRDEASLVARVEQTKPGAILAVPGISAAGVQAIADVAQTNQVYSLALDSSMVQKNIAIGVVAKEGRPQIMINLNAAKSVGAAFEGTVLKLAKVVQ